MKQLSCGKEKLVFYEKEILAQLFCFIRSNLVCFYSQRLEDGFVEELQKRGFYEDDGSSFHLRSELTLSSRNGAGNVNNIPHRRNVSQFYQV